MASDCHPPELAVVEIDNGLPDFLRGVHHERAVADDGLDAWATRLTHLLREYIDSHPDPAHFHWPVLTPTDLADFRRAIDGFVVTVTDKSGPTLQLVCAKYYVESCLHDLTNHPEYYVPITPERRAQLYATLNDRLHHVHLAFTPAAGDAYYAGTLKMHKSPPTFRYLACSHAAPSRVPADVLTAILRCTAVEFRKLWASRLPDTPIWMCDNSRDVMDMLAHFNTRQYPVYAPAQPPPCPGPNPPLPDVPLDPGIPTHPLFAHAQARDFTRLYTNLPQNLLNTTLDALVRAVFDHAGARSVIVTAHQPKGGDPDRPPPKTYTAAFSARAAGPSDPDTHRLSVADVLTLLDCVLSASILRFGPVLVHQICGIPMGISPSPFIANLFLAWYEFQFLSQLSAPARTPPQLALLKRFRWSKRYLDDLLALRNVSLDALLYRSQTVDGLHGIYPPELQVPPQNHPHLPAHHLPFLDVLLVHTVCNGCSRYHTRLYDKRVQPSFAHVRLSRFVPASSSVNEAAKRNIFTGQFRRLQRVITDPQNFIDEVAFVICSLASGGYSASHLLRQCADQVALDPTLFYVERRRDHLDLPAAIRARVAATLPPRAYASRAVGPTVG